MTRNLMIALGVILWGTFAVAATALYLMGHWIAPTVTLMVGVPLVSFRVMRRRSPREPRTTG